MFTCCIVIVLSYSRLSSSQDITNVEDVQVLSELSLDKLLTIKRSFGIEDPIEDVNISSRIGEFDITPQALALQALKKIPKDRGSYYHQHYPSYHYVEDYKSDKKSVKSIFQLSVTTLAFLAFGGYLLCLLVQAVRGKNSYNPNMMTQVMATYLAAKLKKRKNPPQRYQRVKKKRPTNPQIVSTYNYRPKRDIFDTTITDDMYSALINLSESYKTYHTIDYITFNSSLNVDH